MELGFDVADIAKTLGGLFAFVVVLYIGVLFYKKESSFSDEYVLLLKQYKDRNELLQAELDTERLDHAQEINVLKVKMDEITAKHIETERELNYLRNLVASPPRTP